MILSERVGGKLTSWGVIVACSIALLALPGWSTAQQAEQTDQPTSSDAQDEKNTPANPPASQEEPTPKPKALKRSKPAPQPPLKESASKQVVVDADLLELIETGKFEEAKARIEAFRAKQAAERAHDPTTKEKLPQKWTADLFKGLPAQCIEGLPQKATLDWKGCMRCHNKPDSDAKGLVEPSADNPRKYRRTLKEMPGSSFDAIELYDPTREAQVVALPGAARLFIGFRGSLHLYALTFEDAVVVLAAHNVRDGEVLWRTQFAVPPADRPSADRWTLQETADGKLVVLIRYRKTDRIQYSLDLATGSIAHVLNLANAQESESADETDSENAKEPPTDHFKRTLSEFDAKWSQLRDPFQGATSPNLIQELQRAEAALAAATARANRLAEIPAAAADQDVARVEVEQARQNMQVVINRIKEAYKAAESDLSEVRKRYQQIAPDPAKYEEEVRRHYERVRAAEEQQNPLGKLPGPESAPGKETSQDVRQPFHDLVSLAAKLTAEGKSDAEVIEALYRAVIGRDPTTAERDFCVKYLAAMAKDRETAIGNILFQLSFTKETKSASADAEDVIRFAPKK